MPLKFDCEFVTRCSVIRVQEILLGNGFAGQPMLPVLLRQASLPLHDRSSSSLSSWCWVWQAVSDSSSQAQNELRLQHPSRSPVLLGHFVEKFRV
jgi:hypothetical protein